MKPKPIYDDGTYHVSASVIATPVRFYPIANTTARIRRDPLWIAMALAAFIGTTFSVYGDLLYPAELVSLVAIAALALIGGLRIAILVLDAPGHQPAAIVGSLPRIRKLYRAIRDARAAEFSVFSVVAEGADGSDQD